MSEVLNVMARQLTHKKLDQDHPYLPNTLEITFSALVLFQFVLICFRL
jgi:hypothetical protein